jgi:dienelactone hydrolase
MKIAALFLFLCCGSLLAGTMDLAGSWQFRLDPQDQGIVSNFWEQPFDDTITLPGSTSQADKGTPLVRPPTPAFNSADNLDLRHGLTFGKAESTRDNAAFAHLYPRYSYVGPAWYRRTVEIPASWTGQEVELELERAMWETRAWVNGQFMGARNSLLTPQRYEIGAALKPGRNEIVLRVDNRRQLAIGDPHAYTEQASGIWNGVIGRIELTARAAVSVKNLQLRPDLARQGVAVTVQTHNGTGHAAPLELSLQARPGNFHGPSLPVFKKTVLLPSGDGEQTFFYPMGTNFERWSEFNPKLYQMQATLNGGDHPSECTATFGMREFQADGNRLTINGEPVFLRGDVECSIFPKTGYPDMTDRQWRKIITTVKAYGLNHLRFHTWCPPEAAFALADQYGIYMEVELPDWSFKIGQDPAVTEYFRQEGERMIREYGNHPSWVMFTMGNELKGDYGVLDNLVAHFRSLDPELLYASTTYPSSSRGKVPGPNDDYYISQDTATGRARGQDIFNETEPNTETNFERAVSSIHVPFLSHEVGQYCVYPNVAELPKYNGVMRATGYEAIRDDLQRKGRLQEAAIYVHDSGELAALLYKEEIERALRTTNQAGFQLLELPDFPGQGTSTVGLLDSFWDSKGLITPREFREFCGPVTPLLLMPKRVWQNDEVFDAGVEVANYGPAPLTDVTVNWSICDGSRRIGTGSFKVTNLPQGPGHEFGRIRQSFLALTKAAKLTVSVAIPGTSIANDWSVWVYPENEAVVSTNKALVFQEPGEAFYAALRAGQKVLLLPPKSMVKSPLAAQFVPVFWNPVMFPNQPGSMGAMIDAHHPLFADFPTDAWTDWQWWELTSHSFALNLDDLPEKVAMPFRFVDKFDRNALATAIFEARVGPGRLVVCTLDITNDLGRRIAARQLRRSILAYMAGNHFKPKVPVPAGDLEKLFQPATKSAADEVTPGDRLLADYFKTETAKISGSCLADIHTLADWQARRPELRREAAEMLGLDPLPARTPLHPVITGTLEKDDFTVEKLCFEPEPHLYITASLYLPKHLTNPAPAVLYLSGHLSVITNGVSYGNKVAYQQHGIWFARNGYVCLMLDTLQYGEIPGHHQGTFAEGKWWWNSRGYTPAGLETWNAIRGLDYLASLPEVDTNRMGVTGRSGGGAYSWFLAALDDRVSVIAPVAGITDLQNYLVDGTVDDHCDCMFLVNTYHWDYPLLAALCAPRPLLLANTDADEHFPLDGVVRTRNALKRIYDLYGAGTNFGFVVAPGPHKDTQDLQLPVFRWFNIHLKHEDPVIAMAAVKMFSPRELKVLDSIPQDQINTSIENSFVPVAQPPKVPATKEDWEQMQEKWMKDLREKCFSGWPADSGPPPVKCLRSEETGGVRYAVYEIQSQTDVPLRIYLMQPASGASPSRLVLHIADSTVANGADDESTNWIPDLRQTLALSGAPETADRLVREVKDHSVAYAVFLPRGMGANSWSGGPGRLTQIRRRFMLIGQTLDGMRVWDIRRAMQALHSMAEFHTTPVVLEAGANMGVNALYASLFEPGISSLELRQIPASHREGPDYLNVLKYLDIPEAVAMAADRCNVVLQPAQSAGWDFLHEMSASPAANLKISWMN